MLILDWIKHETFDFQVNIDKLDLSRFLKPA